MNEVEAEDTKDEALCYDLIEDYEEDIMDEMIAVELKMHWGGG